MRFKNKSPRHIFPDEENYRFSPSADYVRAVICDLVGSAEGVAGNWKRPLRLSDDFFSRPIRHSLSAFMVFPAR